MTHHRLGHEGEARSWYERGVARIERSAPKHAGWNYVRQRAAVLLGIDS
jgi:hypothetical protein